MADNPTTPGENPPSPNDPAKDKRAPALPVSQVGQKASGSRVMVMLSSVAKAPPTHPSSGEASAPAAPIKPPALAIRNPISLPKRDARTNKITMSIAPKKVDGQSTAAIPKITIPVPVAQAPPPTVAAVPVPKVGVPPPLPVKTESDEWKKSQVPFSAPSVISPDPSITVPGQKHDFQSWKNLKANVPPEGALQSLEAFREEQAAATQPPPITREPETSLVQPESKPAGPPPPALAKKAEPVPVPEPDKKAPVAPPIIPSQPVAAPVVAVASTPLVMPPPLQGAKTAPADSPSPLRKPLDSPATAFVPTLTSELPTKVPPPLVAPTSPSPTASPVTPVDGSVSPAAPPPPMIEVEPKHVVPAPLVGAIASHVLGAVPPLLVEKDKDDEVSPAHKLAPPQLPPATPRDEAPPLINVKASSPVGTEPPKLATPGAKGLKGKVLEVMPAKKSEPVTNLSPLSAAPMAEAKATNISVDPKTSKKVPAFFAKHLKSHQMPAPVRTPVVPLAVATVSAAAAAAAIKTPVKAKAVAPPASSAAPLSSVARIPDAPAPVEPKGPATPPPLSPASSAKPPPLTRAARARKKYLIETGIFYFVFALVIVALYIGALYFGRETSVEGQVIPPTGTKLGNEAWIVGDFRELASGIADDLAADRGPKLLIIQDRQQHVQRARADIASREDRIRLLQEQVQAARDDINATIKQARDDAQKIWDGPGAELESEYNAKLNALQKAIADRAKSLNLKYQPDDSYHSPEVWANAYRLALYEVPPGVDGAKEHEWMEAQMKAWRDFTKTVDDRQGKLREQAAAIQLSPTTKVSDANTKIEDLQHRIEGLQAEEDPIKAELQEALADLAEAQKAESGLDEKSYKQLYALPESNVTKRLPIAENGRFTWEHVERDSTFAQGETAHHYWVFVRATREDGRQFWAMHHFEVLKNHPNLLMIEPDSFISTKALLRPDLSPEEQKL